MTITKIADNVVSKLLIVQKKIMLNKIIINFLLVELSNINAFLSVRLDMHSRKDIQEVLKEYMRDYDSKDL